WDRIGLEDYRRDVERAGVETMQVFSVGKAEKNAADMVLVIDCLRQAANLDQLQVFIIVSGDGDFVPLVRRLHELNKYVIGATLADHPVNSVLEQEVDHYVALKKAHVPPAAALKAVFSADPAAKLPPLKAAPAKRAAKKAAAGRAVEAPAQPAKKQAAPKKQPAEKAATKQPAKKQPAKTQSAKKQLAPGKSPAGKDSWHDMATEIAVVHAGPAKSPEDYKAIVKQLLSDSKVRSFFDKLANQGGTLPILAMALKAAAPQLSPSDARVSTLSRALRFALAGTQYALARESDDVQPVLVRRSANPPGMLSDLSLDDIQRGVQ
ncbi:MAG: hypothetical protein QOJ72_2132, partial [Nocardioidaceae bacterium]|nr:hypothetical protein [Nocardioidaceae bacterium]